MNDGDPPIIIAAQTNHALDQLMKHVMRFEPKVVRLGGRTAKENKDIIDRTLYQLRINNQDFNAGGRGLRQRKAELDAKIVEIQNAIAPLLSTSLLSDDLLFKYGIINQGQKDSLYDDGWDDPADEIQPKGIAACKFREMV
jgi:helicase required for RNAi-mediated heterochromatin assembly 1